MLLVVRRLLKKSLKRSEAKKKKSAAAWKARNAQDSKAQGEAREKRAKNLDKLGKKRIAKRLKRKGMPVPTELEGEKKKRPRRRPGFEGKHAADLLT